MSNRFVLSTISIEDRWFAVAYDLEKRATIPELIDYSLHISGRLQFSRLTLEKRLGQLLNFWEFLSREGIALEAVCDAVLVRFRDTELVRVLHRETSRGNELTAKRTVNDKLGAVYAWLTWMYESGRLLHLDVGLSARRMPWNLGDRSKARNLKDSTSGLNISFRRTGAASKNSATFVATGRTYDEITEQFFAGKSLYTAHRNALILAIADAVGFRRGSIASLSTLQFIRADLEAEQQPVVLVRPPAQKFAYGHEFLFPVWLALRVCDFCDTYRIPLVQEKRATLKQTQHRIFLSARDASPLSERAITQIFSKAMRSAGAPKGAALHAFRAKFANDQIDLELQSRAKSGMDTSSSAVAAAVAMKLGHKNPNSIYSYVVAAQTKRALSERVDSAEHIDRLAARVHSLLLENAELRARSRMRKGVNSP